jgi:multidrug efflux pump subunit AcrB
MSALLRRLFANHPLANLAYVILLALGVHAYVSMPRALFPEVNLNWVVVASVWPGASATEVEQRLTGPLESAIRKVGGVRFSSSTSREHYAVLMLRFEDSNQRAFEQRVAELRREVQIAAATRLPKEAQAPTVLELTTSSSFPTALVVLDAPTSDGRLCNLARATQRELERLPGVDQVHALGLRDPELQVDFHPDRMRELGVRPDALMDMLRAQLQAASGGSTNMDGRDYLLRVLGTEADHARIAELPVPAARGGVRLADIAQVHPGIEPAREMVRHAGNPAVLLAITKKADASALDLVADVNAWIASKNRTLAPGGPRLHLLDDQSQAAEDAIGVMENNAVIGLFMVLAITWLFLGARMAWVVALGVPFSLAGTFLAMHLLGQTLNVATLLGLIIVIGALVDQAVVMVEVIHQRLRAGADALTASLDALREVGAPVTTTVLTIVAAFLPLMLMDGVIGEFMAIVPLVVTVALLGSLTEAFWMVPAHVSALRALGESQGRWPVMRERLMRALQRRYARALAATIRRPALALALFAVPLALAALALVQERVPVRFFALDALRVFNINVEMPPGTPLEETLRVTRELEDQARARLPEESLRDAASLAGHMFTTSEQISGANVGQVTISLKPGTPGGPSAETLIEALRAPLTRADPDGRRVTLQTLNGGPPLLPPIHIKLRGDDLHALRAATANLSSLLAQIPGVRDIGDDSRLGAQEIVLRLDPQAAAPLGLDPARLAGLIRMHTEGVVLARIVDARGEPLQVRLRAAPEDALDMQSILDQTLPLPDGGEIAVGKLFTLEPGDGQSVIRHHNMKRAITVSADLDKTVIDSPRALARVRAAWDSVADKHPGVSLDFSGEFDDIGESLSDLWKLFLLGVGLIFLILAMQFGSYAQPLIILATIPPAFVGMVLGLALYGYPLSLFTLYGGVANAGVAISAAIVLVAAGNQRAAAGMSPLHACMSAARRRLAPILITSLTTVGGLAALAYGWGGTSLTWGPLATAIVWGPAFSTLVTLFTTPLLHAAQLRASARFKS